MICVTTLGAVALAAPLMPRPARDDISRYDAAYGLKRVRVEVMQYAPVLQRGTISADEIEDIWSRRLKEEGLEVVESGETPRIVITMKGLPWGERSEITAFGLFMTLDQSAHVHRLDATMRIPTYSNSMVGVIDTDGLEKELRKAVAFQIRKFVSHIRTKSAEQ